MEKACSQCGKRLSKCCCPGHVRGYSTQRYLRNRAYVLAESLFCWICEQPRWPNDTNPNTGKYDPLTADHVLEVAAGGDNLRTNLRAAHLSCNGRRGAQYRETR